MRKNYMKKRLQLTQLEHLNLAKICKKKKIVLVQTSTHAVFDGKKGILYGK